MNIHYIIIFITTKTMATGSDKVTCLECGLTGEVHQGKCLGWGQPDEPYHSDKCPGWGQKKICLITCKVCNLQGGEYHNPNCPGWCKPDRIEIRCSGCYCEIFLLENENENENTNENK